MICAPCPGSGAPETRYVKFTFRKEIARQSQHLDSVLVSPGHPLFAAVDESLNQKIGKARAGTARFVDPFSPRPYRLHFFDVEVEGGTIDGRYEPASGALVTVVEDDNGALELGAPDILHDLTPAENPGEIESDDQRVERVRKFVMAQVQYEMTAKVRAERSRDVEIRRKYLDESFRISIRRARERWMRFADEVTRGRESFKLARDNAMRDVEALERRRDEKLATLDSLAVVSSGRVEYLGTAIVEPTDAAGHGMQRDDEVEAAAMAETMRFEREHGWEPTDVSQQHDGSGFDIRSVSLPDEHGQRLVRRIEVKGRAGENLPVELTPNEWVQAGRHRETFWLYVVWNAKTQPRLMRVQDPVASLRGHVEELIAVNGYRVPAEAIAKAAT